MDLDKAWKDYLKQRHEASNLYKQADAFYDEMTLPPKEIYKGKEDYTQPIDRPSHKSEHHTTAKELAFELYNAADQIVHKAERAWKKALYSVYGYVITQWIYKGNEKRGGYDCKIINNGVVFRYA